MQRARIIRNGDEQGKSAWLYQRRDVGTWKTLASIFWDGVDWVLRSGQGRIDRFEHLNEAKDEAWKLI